MTPTATRATLPVLRALLDQARRKDYRSGVLGVRARPEWTGAATFTHFDVPVRVVPCVSALAVREALLERAPGRWLVVLTDRLDDDLGAGVLSHLVWHRLRTPDPWDAVRLSFAATGIDPALTSAPGDRDIAVGLLVTRPAAGWAPAPGGVLTRDHALGAVAAAHLGLADPVADITSVLAWTSGPAVTDQAGELRALAGDALAGAVLDWVAGCAGAVGRPLLYLLRSGETRDALPLGLVAGLLSAARDGVVPGEAGQAVAETAQLALEARQLAREALIRFEPRFGGQVPDRTVLQSWAAESTAIIAVMLADPESSASAQAMLARADELLAASHAGGLAGVSDVLPTGLTRRFAALAAVLRAALAGAAAGTGADRDLPQIPDAALADVEQAWIRVATHRLAETDDRTPAFHAAVRLVRWLAVSSAPGGSALLSLAGRHSDSDAWVDSAVNDAAPGVSDPELGAGLAAVLAVVRARRAAHDLAFAAALAGHTSDDPGPGSATHGGLLYLEELLPKVILPLARQSPVLLLVLDGMSAAVGTEVARSVLSRTGDGWAEVLLPGHARRTAALAVLPTLTDVSRASLLCGELRTGGQDVEQRGYEALTDAYGLPGSVLFHKRPLDSSRLGHAVADDVAVAIANVTGQPLVTCVLNTIDDALDRSDPGGTDWGTDTVKHLMPLLDRARHAGRIVVLTADHGHIIERRQGTQRSYATISSSRSRAATEPAATGEILVTGRRVLRHEGRAVLAVDEHLRYGPLKAGYHGGAAPAEAVVPVIVLVPGVVSDDVDLRPAPPQEPSWWIDPAASTAPAASLPTGTAASRGAAGGRSYPAADLRQRPGEAAPTLFDEAGTEPAPPAADRAAGPGTSIQVAVTKSSAFTAQKKIAGRVSVTDDQVRQLLAELLAAPGRRLVPARAATALAVPQTAVRGAVLHAQRLLNVEGYPVLRIDADGFTVILDEALLREQFGIRA